MIRTPHPAYPAGAWWNARFVDENGHVFIWSVATGDLAPWKVVQCADGQARRFAVFWIDPWASEVVYRA